MANDVVRKPMTCRGCGRRVEVEIQWKRFRNNTLHLEAKCVECGHVRYLPQSDGILAIVAPRPIASDLPFAKAQKPEDCRRGGQVSSPQAGPRTLIPTCTPCGLSISILVWKPHKTKADKAHLIAVCPACEAALGMVRQNSAHLKLAPHDDQHFTVVKVWTNDATGLQEAEVVSFGLVPMST